MMRFLRDYMHYVKMMAELVEGTALDPLVKFQLYSMALQPSTFDSMH